MLWIYHIFFTSAVKQYHMSRLYLPTLWSAKSHVPYLIEADNLPLIYFIPVIFSVRETRQQKTHQQSALSDLLSVTALCLNTFHAYKCIYVRKRSRGGARGPGPYRKIAPPPSSLWGCMGRPITCPSYARTAMKQVFSTSLHAFLAAIVTTIKFTDNGSRDRHDAWHASAKPTHWLNRFAEKEAHIEPFLLISKHWNALTFRGFNACPLDEDSLC